MAVVAAPGAGLVTPSPERPAEDVRVVWSGPPDEEAEEPPDVVSGLGGEVSARAEAPILSLGPARARVTSK